MLLLELSESRDSVVTNGLTNPGRSTRHHNQEDPVTTEQGLKQQHERKFEES